jgi:hypothetical protein
MHIPFKSGFCVTLTAATMRRTSGLTLPVVVVPMPEIVFEVDNRAWSGCRVGRFGKGHSTAARLVCAPGYHHIQHDALKRLAAGSVCLVHNPASMLAGREFVTLLGSATSTSKKVCAKAVEVQRNAGSLRGWNEWSIISASFIEQSLNTRHPNY